MRATIRDLKATLQRPAVIARYSIAILASTVICYFFGYLIWRRFVQPAQILFVALIAWRIAKHINQPDFSRVVGIGSGGLAVSAIVIILAAFVDGALFPNTGYFTFAAVVLMWEWFTFQLDHVEKRFAPLPQKQRDLITQSTAVIMAIVEDTKAQNEIVINEYKEVAERFGVKASLIG